ncbi:MAG TPA: hypothetical protein VN765_15640 [Candidatus Acidoferrum sp.]|nr:hypothetical protein [Candidatus Acidoferrum sp.]
MRNKHPSVQPVRDAVAVTVALLAMFAWCGSATGAFYLNCAGCHTTPQTGMAIANYQTTTNLGNGLLRVFQVNPGQTAVIQWMVTNGYGGDYGLNINNLDAAGVNNSSNHMAYTADPAWSSYFPGTTTNFFMVGCSTTCPHVWTFNLVVKTNTPTDFYLVHTQMAGYDSASAMWSQQESFYVQVVAAAPKLSISKVGNRVIISWPGTSDCILQQSSTLAASAAWTTNGFSVTTNANGAKSINITPSAGSLFFRLANP